MNKMILKDSTEIEIKYAYGLQRVIVNNITINKLEEHLTDANLSEVEFLVNNCEINGKYKNLKLININKDYTTKEIIISLYQKVIAQ